MTNRISSSSKVGRGVVWDDVIYIFVSVHVINIDYIEGQINLKETEYI